MFHRNKTKIRYSLWSNIAMAWKDIKIFGYRYYGYLLLNIMIQIIIPFLLILIPAEVLRLLQSGIELSEILVRIAVWIGGILVLNLIRTYVDQEIKKMGIMLSDIQYWSKFNKKLLSCDISELEEPDSRKRLSEVRGYLSNSDGMGQYDGVIGFYMYGSAFIINVGGFLLYASMAGRLHILLLFLLVFTSIVNCIAKSRAIHYQFNNMDSFWENNSRFWYLKRESINTEKAKDIRMYGMYQWFKNALDKNTKEATKLYGNVQKHHYYANIIINITAFLRDAGSYLFLIILMMKGKMEVAEFLIYVGIVAGFGTWISQMVASYTYIKRINLGISKFREYVGEKSLEKSREENTNEDKEDMSIPKTCSTIVFEDVSFSYGDKMIFEHFSLTLNAGEKVALVGINGAGKTTLMKLLCGLYPLSGGRILIDGVDINTIEKEEYRRYISILFQEICVLPFSIAKNISCAWTKEEEELLDANQFETNYSHAFSKVDKDLHENKYEEERVLKSLEQTKLLDKVLSLPKGIHTSLTKILDLNGIQLSGGETQRLMLARALYKNAPILILDEPTAALDPIAESELYEEYAGLCKGKISVFISHRLSSTRFCDRILFLEHGRILEEGNHESLMKKAGEYAKMYQVQSHYYQKEVEKLEAGI